MNNTNWILIDTETADFQKLRHYCLLGFDKLNEYLLSISKDHAEEMISIAQKFLRSKSGIAYSFEGFANNVFNLIENNE